jgi:hypothetical protein
MARTIILSEYESIQYANTNSKGVIGAMSEWAFHYAHNLQV